MSRPAFATRTTGKRTPWQDILWRNTNEGDRTIIGENIFHLKACFHLQFGSHVLYPFLFVDLVCRVLSYYYSISITKSLEAHCKFQTLCWGISDKLVWSSCDAKRFPNCKIHSEFNVSDSQVVSVTASWSYISYEFIWVIIWVSYESYRWTIFVSKKSERSVKKYKEPTFSASRSVWRIHGLGGTCRADRMGTIGPRALRRGEFRASFQFFSYVSCSKKSWHVLTHFETTWNVSNNAFKNVLHWVLLSFEFTVFNVKKNVYYIFLHVLFRTLSIASQ